MVVVGLEICTSRSGCDSCSFARLLYNDGAPTVITNPHRLAQSQRVLVRSALRGYRAFSRISVPLPRIVLRMLLLVFLLTRGVYHFLWRVLVCDPLFKAYCTSYGKHLHTDVFIHWVQGRGRIIVGDD